jgi:hypothetical protein
MQMNTGPRIKPKSNITILERFHRAWNEILGKNVSTIKTLDNGISFKDIDILGEFRRSQAEVFEDLQAKLPRVISAGQSAFEEISYGFEGLRSVDESLGSTPILAVQEFGESQLQVLLYEIITFHRKYEFYSILSRVLEEQIMDPQLLEAELSKIKNEGARAKLKEVHDFRMACDIYKKITDLNEKGENFLHQQQFTEPSIFNSPIDHQMRENMDFQRACTRAILFEFGKDALIDLGGVAIQGERIQALGGGLKSAFFDAIFHLGKEAGIPFTVGLPNGLEIPPLSENYWDGERIVNLKYCGWYGEKDGTPSLCFTDMDKVQLISHEQYRKLKVISRRSSFGIVGNSYCSKVFPFDEYLFYGESKESVILESLKSGIFREIFNKFFEHEFESKSLDGVSKETQTFIEEKLERELSLREQFQININAQKELGLENAIHFEEPAISPSEGEFVIQPKKQEERVGNLSYTELKIAIGKAIDSNSDMKKKFDQGFNKLLITPIETGNTKLMKCFQRWHYWKYHKDIWIRDLKGAIDSSKLRYLPKNLLSGSDALGQEQFIRQFSHKGYAIQFVEDLNMTDNFNEKANIDGRKKIVGSRQLYRFREIINRAGYEYEFGMTLQDWMLLFVLFENEGKVLDDYVNADCATVSFGSQYINELGDLMIPICFFNAEQNQVHLHSAKPGDRYNGYVGRTCFRIPRLVLKN